MTQYLYRVWLIVPTNRKDGLDEFIRAEFDDNDWLTVSLNATGTGTASHYMTCFACTHEQTSRWADRLTSEGGIPLPPEFSGMNADQRITFMEGASATLKQLTGVIVRVCRNDVMPWALDVDTVLEEEGLQRINNELAS